MCGDGSRDPLALRQPTNPCSRTKRCGPVVHAVQDPEELVAPVGEDGRRHALCCFPGRPVQPRRFPGRMCVKAKAGKDGARIVRMRAPPSASCEVHELSRRKLPSLDLDIVSCCCDRVGRRCAGHPQNIVATDAVRLAVEREGNRRQGPVFLRRSISARGGPPRRANASQRTARAWA